MFDVKLDDDFLMSSKFTAAEVELARMALAAAPDRPLDVVVGGLGLGHTAAAVLDDERVRSLVVVEALAPVIGWHRDHLVPLGRRLAEDPRCRLVEGDFFALALGGGRFEPDDAARSEPDGAARSEPDGERRWDAVVVDIDHTPRHLLHPRHAPFYASAGIARVLDLMRPGGVFALWSNDPPDAEYLARLAAVMPSAAAHVVEFPDASGAAVATNTVYLAAAPGG